ncbi:MAG: hypothetical protein O3B04_01170 [Chloroflexi bacterium]|nr:hypothetical protein [Chloroflexota bacterium]
MRRPSVIALIAITIVFVASTLPANAGSQAAEEPGSLTVIALDSGAARSNGDIAMMETALMTLAGNLGDGEMAVIRYGEQVSPPVTAPAGTDVITVAAQQLNLVRQSGPALKSDQFDVLTNAFSFLTRMDAKPGSRVVLITPGRILGESENTGARLNSVGDLYASEDWTIDVATLPSTEPDLRALLSQLSTSSGGRYFDLGTPEGLQFLLFQASDVDLDTVIDAELSGSEVASTFEVAPMTAIAKIAFLRFNPETDVALYRPNGTKVTSDLENVEIIESPNVVIFSITGPAAGSWTANGTGNRGKLIAGVDARTPLTVQLLEQPPLPLGEPGLLSAAAVLAGDVIAVPGTRLEAAVRQADGFTNVYQLNDEGLAGDVTAGDGIFSVRLPSPEAQGINDVALTMTWANLKSELTGGGTYKTEQFPAVRVTRMFDINAHEGDEAVIATVESFVGEFPYLASPDEFSVTVVSVGEQFAGRLQPRSEPEPGKGFAFDVLATLPASGDYSVSVVLNTVYLGRQYFTPGPAISTNATITPQPFLIVGLPIWAWSVIGFVAVAGLAVVVLQSRRVHPYGYIYDDQDNLLVDFARLRRNWTRRFTATDRVDATEIHSLPFRAGTFRFTRGGVKFEYDQSAGQPSLRVNSRPAADVVELDKDVWLGISGKLLTFTEERRPRTGMAFAPADD